MKVPWSQSADSTQADSTQAESAQTAAPAKHKRPLYPRLLDLRHIHPNAWQRALLGEGALALAVVLVLADVASAWTLLVLPLAVAVVVKAHDLLAGLLSRPVADAAPGLADVWFAGGFCGHGMSFAPRLGQLLAQAVSSGRKPAALVPLAVDRPTLTPMAVARTVGA